MKKIKYKANYSELTVLLETMQNCINRNSERGYSALVTFAAFTQMYMRVRKMLFFKKESYSMSLPMLEACAFCHYYEKGKLPVVDAYNEVVVRELYTLIDKQVV